MSTLSGQVNVKKSGSSGLKEVLTSDTVMAYFYPQPINRTRVDGTEEWYKFLRNYRATPPITTGKPPAELLWLPD